MLSVVIQALIKSVMFLCTSFPNFCLIYSDWAFEITLHSGFILCRFTSLGFGIHLITALSIVNCNLFTHGSLRSS